MVNTQTELAVWLDNLIGEDRKYASNRRFAEAAGIAPDTVRRILDGEVPSLKTFQKIADAEPGVSLADLQRMAGILPKRTDGIKEELIRSIENIVTRLPPEDQKFIRDMAERMLERNQLESKE